MGGWGNAHTSESGYVTLLKQGWYRIATTNYYASTSVLPNLFSDIYISRIYYRDPSEAYCFKVATCYIAGEITLISKVIMHQIIRKARLVMRELSNGKVYWAFDVFYAYESKNPACILSNSLWTSGTENEKGFTAIRPNGTVELDESIDTVVREIELI